MQEAILLTGEDGIQYGRLASLKYGLRMEKVGMKTRGGAIRPKIAAELGLKKTDSHDKFIEEIKKRMDAILSNRAMKESEGQTKH